MLQGVLLDLISLFWKNIYSLLQKDKEKNEELYNKTFKEDFENLHRYLNGKDFLIGKLSISDFFFYEIIEYLKSFYEDKFNEFPNFIKWYNNM